MTIRELFDFIVDRTINDDTVDSYLEEVQNICMHTSTQIRGFWNVISLMTCGNPFCLIQVQKKILARGDEISAEEEIADLVFVQVCYLSLDFLYWWEHLESQFLRNWTFRKF